MLYDLAWDGISSQRDPGLPNGAALMGVRGLLALLCLALVVTGCDSIQVEAGFRRPVELTATAIAQQTRPTAAPKPRLGKVAFVRGGDVWVKALPDGEAKRLTWDGRNIEPRWSPSGEWLAFWKDDRVWVARPDGTDARQVVGSRAIDGFAWSPVEDLIAYTNGPRLLVVSADGGSRRELVADLPRGSAQDSLGAVAWSPDGQWLAYERSARETGSSGTLSQSYQGLAVVRADGSAGPWDIYGADDRSRWWCYLASWSSDGQSLLFWRGEPSTSSALADGLPLMKLPIADADPMEVVSRMPVRRELLDWSADGKLVLTDGGLKESWDGKQVVILSQTGPIQVSDRGRSDLFPAWSPDGKWIAFSGAPAAPGVTGGEEAKRALAERRIWIVQPDGSAKLQITNDAAYRDERPRWSADGTSILFGRIFGGQQMQLWLMQRDGSELRQVVDELTSAPSPAPQWFGPYGYVAWGSVFDWWTGQPPVRRSVPPLKPPQGK